MKTATSAFAIVSVLALGAAPASHAAEVAGVLLPATETVGGTRLELKACAAREELWTNLYAVSFYLPSGTGVAQGVSGNTAKLVRLDVTYDGQVPDGLPSTWKEQLQQHVSQEFLRTMQGLYNNLKGGDTVLVSFLPGSGTTVSVNGQQVSTSPGDDALNAMMRLWVGQNPVSGSMKRLLLSGQC